MHEAIEDRIEKFDHISNDTWVDGYLDGRRTSSPAELSLKGDIGALSAKCQESE